MSLLIEEKAASEILKGISIPPQPQIMVDLQFEMAMPEVNIGKIAEIISKDVGISGSVLKVVNSPFFRLRNQITSINQALNLLGVNNAVNIVNSLSIRDSLTDRSIVELTRFWDNAIDVAMASAAISRMIGIASPDEAYTLGLFHNSGIALLIGKFKNYPKVLQAAYAEQKNRITEIENTKIDCNHSVIGYYVARSWKLPSYLAEAIADHHKTEPIFSENVICDTQKKNLLATLKLAETICKTYKSLGRADQDYEFARIKKNLLLYLGLSEYDFENLQAELLDMGLGQQTV